MIAWVEGTVGEIWENYCLVITSSGTGYRVALPAHTLAQLPAKGQKICFYTSLVVREDALELFGFETFEERQTFEILTGISRVGSRTALAILSVYRPVELQAIVADGDVAGLTRVSGIGQKTAQHIFLELKYKLGSVKTANVASGGTTPGIFADTVAALANLGYSEDECIPLVREILKEEPDLDVGSAIRTALRGLAKGKS